MDFSMTGSECPESPLRVYSSAHLDGWVKVLFNVARISRHVVPGEGAGHCKRRIEVRGPFVATQGFKQTNIIRGDDSSVSVFQGDLTETLVDVQEGLYHGRVEMRALFFDNDLDGFFMRELRFVDTFARQGIIGVSQSHESARHGNLVSLEAFRISRPVPFFMMCVSISRASRRKDRFPSFFSAERMVSRP